MMTPQAAACEALSLTIQNPATGDVVGTIGISTESQIESTVARARVAQEGWAALGLDDRAKIVLSAVANLKAHAAEMGRLACAEMGKPLRDAIGEANYAADGLATEVAEIVEALRPELLEDEKTSTKLLFNPLGVAAVITPWNFPILMPSQSVVPALIAGNTVVLKPSEVSPLCAQLWARCMMDALPSDVLSIIHGDGTSGRTLVRSAVDLIVFTGSRATGAAIMREASDGLKRLILELGGKDPLIVLEDADIAAAAAFAVRNSFRNAGQVCVSTERIYVSEKIADAFIAAVVDGARALKQGDGALDDTHIGPMAITRQKSIVMGQLQSAVAQGARCLFGEMDGCTPSAGNFIRPTVLVDVTHTMSIMRDETFGPVAAIMQVKSDGEAIALANDTPYGLGAAVFGSPDRAASVAEQLQAGMVGINRGCGGATGSPWVGARQSGHGFHSGKYGHRQFAQLRVVSRAK
ncbi:MAG: aldehyde dehydrogenase family protein [Planctomycetota bacterium]|nr:aldehyde dehydrogenase family protein [Planctomycetota bacterium]